MIKKIISCLLTATTAIAATTSLAACEATQRQYTLKLISTPLSAASQTLEHNYTIQWDDKVFSTSPKDFSPELARTAMILSASAYDSEVIQQNLSTLGFEQKAKFNYGDEYDYEAVGIAIASRQVADTTIVAVVMRGTNGKEWYSNFDIGEDILSTQVHAGFEKASQFALEKIEMYMHNYVIDKDHTKFIITGHSRGAAVANLTAASLIDTYSSEDVYAYTFATPNTTKSQNAQDDKYKGIFNFVNPEDFIAFIPLESWDFTKYGTTITFPEKGDEGYDNKLSTASELYESYTNREYKTFDGVDKLNEFLITAHDIAPTVDDYYNKKYEVAGLSLSLYEYMMAVADILNNENVLTNGLILIGSDDTVFAPIRDFIMSGMDMQQASSQSYEDALIGYAHCAESYMCWLDVYIENL